MALNFALMSKIDLFEKFSQTFYAGSLLVAPAWWLSDNFANQAASTNDESLALCG